MFINMEKHRKLVITTILILSVIDVTSSFGFGHMDQISRMSETLSSILGDSFLSEWAKKLANFTSVGVAVNLDSDKTNETETVEEIESLPEDVSFMLGMDHDDIRSHTPESLMAELADNHFDVVYLRERLEERLGPDVDYGVWDVVHEIKDMMGGDYDYLSTTPSDELYPTESVYSEEELTTVSPQDEPNKSGLNSGGINFGLSGMDSIFSSLGGKRDAINEIGTSVEGVKKELDNNSSEVQQPNPPIKEGTGILGYLQTMVRAP